MEFSSFWKQNKTTNSRAHRSWIFNGNAQCSVTDTCVSGSAILRQSSWHPAGHPRVHPMIKIFVSLANWNDSTSHGTVSSEAFGVRSCTSERNSHQSWYAEVPTRKQTWSAGFIFVSDHSKGSQRSVHSSGSLFVSCWVVCQNKAACQRRGCAAMLVWGGGGGGCCASATIRSFMTTSDPGSMRLQKYTQFLCAIWP